MKRRSLAISVLVLTIGGPWLLVLAQAKMVPSEVPSLRFTCDEESGICSMPVKDLRTLVAYAQKGADCR